MEDKKPTPGSIAWVDLTTQKAEELKSFYGSVVGWDAAPVSMGDYDDFAMVPNGSEAPVSGICHARGGNADLPSQWLIYIIVEDLDTSISECKRLGGAVLAGPKEMGPDARYCVIQDPAGAVAALYEKK